MQILIAEDDPTSRTVLQKTLVKLGYGVLVAADGQEAWSLFQRESPPVVITDWMMPRLDGLELCRRIRSDAAHDRYTYLIVLTALGGKRNYLEAMDAGTDDFLTKPFDPDELVTRLRVAERILGMEATLRLCEELLECCPGCRRVRQENGHWAGLGQLARLAPAPEASPVRCPECVQERVRQAGATRASA